MPMLAMLKRPGAGDRAVLVAVILALVVLAAVPVKSDAGPRLEPEPQVCTVR